MQGALTRSRMAPAALKMFGPVVRLEAHSTCTVAGISHYIRNHNRAVNQYGQGVRILSCYLPVKSPWLNPLEPKWVHGKRALVEPARLLSAQEIADRVCAHFDCSMTLISLFPADLSPPRASREEVEKPDDRHQRNPTRQTRSRRFRSGSRARRWGRRKSDQACHIDLALLIEVRDVRHIVVLAHRPADRCDLSGQGDIYRNLAGGVARAEIRLGIQESERAGHVDGRRAPPIWCLLHLAIDMQALLEGALIVLSVDLDLWQLAKELVELIDGREWSRVGI
jgi:hypothetical protein